MAFLRPLAIHNILLPGPTYTYEDRMTQLYQQLWGPGGASDLYVASDPREFTVGSKGPGDYSYLIKRVGALNSHAYCYHNKAVNQAAAPAGNGWLAINPDGDLDPVTNSALAEASPGVYPANQNGQGIQCVYYQGYSLVNVFEFDDAILIFSLNGTGTVVGDMQHFGQIITPEWEDDILGGGEDVRIGLGHLGGQPRRYASATSAFSNSNDQAAVRVSLGNSIGTVAHNASWLHDDVGSVYADQAFQPVTSGWANLGPDGVDRMSTIPVELYNGGTRLGEFKYVKCYPGSSTLAKWQVGLVDYLICLHYTTDVKGFIYVPTTTSYDPLVLGKYT